MCVSLYMYTDMKTYLVCRFVDLHNLCSNFIENIQNIFLQTHTKTHFQDYGQHYLSLNTLVISSLTVYNLFIKHFST